MHVFFVHACYVSIFDFATCALLVHTLLKLDFLLVLFSCLLNLLCLYLLSLYLLLVLFRTCLIHSFFLFTCNVCMTFLALPRKSCAVSARACRPTVFCSITSCSGYASVDVLSRSDWIEPPWVHIILCARVRLIIESAKHMSVWTVPAMGVYFPGRNLRVPAALFVGLMLTSISILRRWLSKTKRVARENVTDWRTPQDSARLVVSLALVEVKDKELLEKVGERIASFATQGFLQCEEIVDAMWAFASMNYLHRPLLAGIKTSLVGDSGQWRQEGNLRHMSVGQLADLACAYARCDAVEGRMCLWLSILAWSARWLFLHS